MKVAKERFIMRGCMKLVEKNKSKDIKFIREFSNITVASICRDLNVDNSNIYKNGKKVDVIKNEIDKKIIKLYNNYVNAGDDNE